MTKPAETTANAAPSKASESESLYKYAGIVTFFTLLSRILGMVRDLSISHRFGASSATDAWTQAFRIPNALRRLTAEGSMTIAFIPIYVEVRDQQGRPAAREFGRQVLGLVLAATAILTALGMLLAEPITAISSPGYLDQPEKFELTVRFTRWMFPYLMMVSFVAWAMGVLNTEKRFAAAAASPVLLNLGIIGAVFGLTAFSEPPAFAIAIGILAGGIGQVLLQLPDLRAVGASLVPSFRWNTPAMGRLFRMVGTGLFGMAVYQLNIVLLGILGSYLSTGQVFHYNNATRLSELVLGLFTFAFTTAGLPTLAEHQARKDWVAMTGTIRFTFAAVLFTTLPATVGLFAAADPIVTMLYRHGAFTAADVASTARTLQWMALGMPAIAIVRVLTPVYYAVGDARTPVYTGLATLILTAALGWWLTGPMEVAGLALALSLGTTFQALASALVLRAKAKHLGAWFPWRETFQQAAACIVMGLAVAGMATFGDWPLGPGHLANWALFIPLLGTGVLLYAGLTVVQREEQSLHWVGLAAKAWRKAARLAGRGRRP